MLEDAQLGAPTLSWAQRCADLSRSSEWADADRADVKQLTSMIG